MATPPAGSAARHFTASGIVLSGDWVLLIEHRKAGCWLYPGGHLEPGEDPVQAVLREVREETGIACQVDGAPPFTHPAVTVLPSPFAVCVVDIPARSGEPAHQHIDMVYVLRPGDGTIAPQLTKAAGCEWVHLSRLGGLPMPPELPPMIAAAAGRAQ